VVGILLSASIQIILVVLGVIAALILKSRIRTITFVVLLIPTTGLIRRLVAGPEAHTEADPLLILPILLTIGVMLASLTKPRDDRKRSFMRLTVAATIIGVVGTIVLTRSFDIGVLFSGAMIVIPLLLAILISTGRMPSPWEAAMRALPALAVLVGLYGIYQFFVLPQWDKAWMINSGLTSIGHPIPLQVRVFGTSESPGPYALFIGLVLTICLYIAVVGRTGPGRLPWMTLSIFLAVPLLLSGVRSALIGVVVCAVLLALLRAKGMTRVLIVAFLAGMYYLLTSVIARFGAGSTVLNADRYTQFSSNDPSLTARLTLLNDLRDPFQHLIGDPNAPVADNLFIGALDRFGFLPAAGLFALTVCLILVSIRNLARHHNEIAALCAVFISTQTLFGNVFGSLFGLLVGIVVGTVMKRHTLPPRERGVRPTQTSGLTIKQKAMAAPHRSRLRRPRHPRGHRQLA